MKLIVLTIVLLLIVPENVIDAAAPATPTKKPATTKTTPAPPTTKTSPAPPTTKMIATTKPKGGNPAFMPTSCADVATMGQTVSGLYVIKATAGGKTTLQSVLCDFSGSSPKTTAVSNIPSFTTGPVYFHATRSVTLVADGAVMQFDATPAQSGQNAFNGATGIFTAPVTGNYQFIFSAVAANYQSQAAIYKFSGGKWTPIALGWGQCIQAYPNAGQQYCGYAMVAQVIVSLNKGEGINMYVSSASKDWSFKGGVYQPSTGPVGVPTTQFTGILIEETLTF